MVKQVPRVAFMGSGVDTCFPGVGKLKRSNVMAPETNPCFCGLVELPWDITWCLEHPDVHTAL